MSGTMRVLRMLGFVVALGALVAPAVVAQERDSDVESMSGAPVDLIGEPVRLHSQIASMYGDVDGLTVTETEEGTELRTAADVLFAFDSADLTDEAVALLGEAAGILAEAAPGRVIVEGHTDGLGSDAYNDALSLDRADTVVRELTARPELAAITFQPAGRGSREPIAAERDEEGGDLPDGRARNRRVELIFGPR